MYSVFSLLLEHKADSSDDSATKRRKALTMEVKGDRIRRSEKGETPRNIDRSYGQSPTTVSTIIKDQKHILEHVKGSAPMTSTVVTEQRSGLIIEMERLLVLWLDEQYQRRIPVSQMLIQEKAERLFEALKKEKGEGSESKEFVASKGWFMGFKDRANLHNLKVPGEAASDDAKAAAYAYTYVHCQEGEESIRPKASKERWSVLLGANAAGDFKLKPLVIQRGIKGIWKGLLPVIWKSNKKAWVTLSVFEDWFTNHFVPEVKDYCASRGLPFKVLLVLDSAPCHPANLNDFHPNVKVVYLPPSTSSLLQPMGQGIIASFKAYYLRGTFAMAFRATEKDKELTLNDFWKSYNVLAAVKNISDSWDEVKQTNLNAVWKKLCPQFVNDFNGFENSVEVVIKNVVELSKQLDLEVEAEGVTELLASHGEEVSAEDHTHLKQQFIEEEDTPTPEPRRFTSKELAGAFAMIEEALARFEAQDPNRDRYTKVARGVMDSLRCYKEIWEDKKRYPCRLASNIILRRWRGLQHIPYPLPHMRLQTHLIQDLQHLLQVLPLWTHLAEDLQHLLQVLPLQTHLTQDLQHLLQVLPLRTPLTQYHMHLLQVLTLKPNPRNSLVPESNPSHSHMRNISFYPMFLTPTIIERGQCDSYLRMRAQNMNFEDVAIAFCQEEWEILDEAQRGLYCDVMLEMFALVSFIGPWHKMDDGEAYSEHSVSVGDSQVRASKTAAATQRTHLCKPCFSVLKYILHLTELQVAYFEKSVSLSDACVRYLCFSANPHQQQKDACGEKPWKEDMERASSVTTCWFYFSGVPEASTEAGVDSAATTGLLQHQATLNTEEPHSNNESSQECLSGKRHHQWVECETAASQKQKVAYQKGICSGDMINESNKCGKVFRQIFNHLQHGRVHTVQKPCECTDCGKVFSESPALIKHNRVHIRKKLHKCSDCGKSFSQRSTLIIHHRVHTGETPYECSECGKHFSQRSHLNVHHRVHTGEKPYECNECGKHFSERASLTKHRRVDTGEKP
ncbi:hypothetical protein QTO34_018110 [Cnephaeus nilssonii]|uniref:HTH CENPB-type domain-containing protein n=1 Tax=Cnephaeus nilssonii TaxID=3371016 RepID=A0AA40H9X5_CNENI|nr:hypothetical protein QTO34_018110 [Eptesicus nilssonii]